jgi:hypothetical protein
MGVPRRVRAAATVTAAARRRTVVRDSNRRVMASPLWVVAECVPPILVVCATICLMIGCGVRPSGDAEVCERYPFGLIGIGVAEQDVGGFDVAVQHPFVVCGVVGAVKGDDPVQTIDRPVVFGVVAFGVLLSLVTSARSVQARHSAVEGVGVGVAVAQDLADDVQDDLPLRVLKGEWTVLPGEGCGGLDSVVEAHGQPSNRLDPAPSVDAGTLAPGQHFHSPRGYRCDSMVSNTIRKVPSSVQTSMSLPASRSRRSSRSAPPTAGFVARDAVGVHRIHPRVATSHPRG